MRKVQFLKRLGFAILGTPLAVCADLPQAAPAAAADSLTGMWEANVVAKTGTFRYIYSISSSSYFATGNIDEGWEGFKFSPTVGTYVQRNDGSYSYTERGWIFDMKGKNVGSFHSDGTLRLTDGGTAFNGPGTFTQLDLHGKTLYSEPFASTAKRISA